MGFSLSASLLLTFAFLLITFPAKSTARNGRFQCTSPARCTSLVGYFTPNRTTISSLQSLFTVRDIRSILGANNLPVSTRPNYTFSANQTVKIPIPCACKNGTGVSDGVPIYTVVKDDGLYNIANLLFMGLVKFGRIQEVNNIPNPNLIEVGQVLRIPLPCSCDDVGGEKVVHYGYRVEERNTVEEIATEFGSDVKTLLSINGIANDSELIAAEAFDVPLKACSSSIRTNSSDASLLLSNGTYVYIANDCVKCMCDATNNWTIRCEPSNLKSSRWRTCPSMMCSGSTGLYLGNTTTSSTTTNGCRSMCAYAGYSNTTIYTTLSQDCPNIAPPPSNVAPPPPSSVPPPPNDASRSSVELGSAGVSMSIFNVISKLFNIPLLSVATSFVAEDISKTANKDTTSVERKQLSSVSTALLLAVGIGIFEAFALSLGAGPFLRLMGVSYASEMYIPARKFLILRALGAPAFVVSLALQGILRGFKDTRTPVVCLGIGNLVAAVLFPVLMYHFQLGVTGAAISTVISQYTVAFLMIWHLNKKVVLLPPNVGGLQFGSYIKSGGFVLGRTLAVLVTMTLATSMAARQGSVAMAAHQICMQVWLAVSLLTDALAAAGQALIASSVSKGDFKSVKEVTTFVLKIGVVVGISLAAILGLSFGSLASVFTKDAEVLRIVRTGVLFVGATQPITALAFIFDGLHYGMSDFRYAAYSMMLVGAISSAFLLCVPSVTGLPGIWLGLGLFMSLRMMAGFARLLSRTGPWWFMHSNIQ